MNSAHPAIVIDGLTKQFGELTAVDHLSFRVEPGEVFGLVGPDGAGKTTSLRMMAGVLTPTDGAIEVAGCDVRRDPEKAKHFLSYMPQRFGLYEELTVDENIRFYADLFGVKRKDRETQSIRLLEAAGMSEFRKRQAGRLSGGMKQKLALVCALIHTPKVILLDEPTTGVDPVSRRDFWKILYELALQGVAILTSTAYLDEAERCHRVALLREGKLLFCDTPANLKANLKKGVVAVISSDPRGVRSTLENADGVSSMVLRGDGAHLLVDDANRRIAEFKKALSENSVPFEEIIPATPSIEDLFVETVTAGGRA
ncbi:MAG: ATP-binding cassette domain-containing protein [Acidobacteriaceae bacterium]